MELKNSIIFLLVGILKFCKTIIISFKVLQKLKKIIFEKLKKKKKKKKIFKKKKKKKKKKK